MSPWVKNDPNAGGVKIPPAVQQQVKQRVLDYAAANTISPNLCYSSYSRPNIIPSRNRCNCFS
jgi:hypothetical protein